MKKSARKLPKPPKFFTNFEKKYPEVAKAYKQLGDAVHEQGPLTERERALVKLAVSGSHRLTSALKSHIRKGITAGLTREEMEQVALLLLPTVGFPTTMTMLGVIEEQFVKK
ncbi:MAG: carboxymuconolactone decarboxylase family protein [Flammeovirgaceae bacterium]|nr:MAG: carboxymuconolactone decarboxylase family protein [Flammeovirgaceae bacterium]